MSDPASVKNQVQHLLNLHSILDYTKILRLVSCSRVHVCMCTGVHICACTRLFL